MKRIIVLDDDHIFRRNMCKALIGRGYEVFPVERGEEAIRLAGEKSFDAALIDMRMPGMDGLQVLKEIKEIQPTISGIILTGYGSIPDAVKAIKLGGYHYLTKPCDMAEIEEVLRGIPIEREEGHVSSGVYQGIVGESPGIKKVIGFIQKVKDSSLPVLICGESGTGKELVARALHFDSVRKGCPFIAINCASLKPELLENELFGHVKGAFTGATNMKDGLLKSANGGTLFIDEIADMSPMVQASLLRCMETGLFRPLGSIKETRVNVRIIAAVNKDIEEEVKARRFRHDLYYRLNVCRIDMPPLRDRRDDIPLLVKHFLSTSPVTSGKRIVLSPDAIETLRSYHWPGNVRELINLLGRVILLTKGPTISREHIITVIPSKSLQKDAPSSIDEIERRHILETLKAWGGNISRTARALGIDRRTLQRKMGRYQIRL
ncbi:MAG: sigma-54-dependent Fis family transcriptional regulator [Deltaproteobacteria bacterium]|nr:sigma-54-dependent Fis family transcriptional regulator [Deltaproteobacteria bacterium]